MPTITEQVAALECEHAAGLAQIESQNASIETLTLALAAMTKEKLELGAKLADMKQREDETIAAVEALASSALDMVRTAQRPVGTPAAAASFAPSAGLANVPVADLPKPESPQQSAVAKDGAGEKPDSGASAARPAPAVQRPAPYGQPEPAHGERELPMFLRRGASFDARARISGASPIGAPTSAVDRIKRHLLPALTLMRGQGAPPNAPRKDGGLPMHIRRDTVFPRAAMLG